MFILICFEYIIVESSSDQAISSLLHSLSSDFGLKDLVDLHYFLGLEVHRQSDGLILNQKKYATHLLDRVGMCSCTSCPTPLSTTHTLALKMAPLLALSILLSTGAL
jgi:hypothetical protein